MIKRRNTNRYKLVRKILGNEVYKDTKTGRKYLITWTKTGKTRWIQLKKKKKR